MSKPWKQAEYKAAAILGGHRVPLSGRAGWPSKGDVELPELFVEVKYRARHHVFTTWAPVVKTAAKEGKEPCLVLAQKGAAIRLAVIDIKYLAKLLRDRAELRKTQTGSYREQGKQKCQPSP